MSEKAKAVLQAREAAWVKVVGQLDEQHTWAKEHDHSLLAECLTVASRHALSQLTETQRCIRAVS